MRHLFSASLLPVLLVLTGCALSDNQPVSADVSGSAMQGSVYGGQQPVSGATVALFAVGTSGYGAGATQLGSSVTTDANGNFNFPAGSYTCPFPNTPVYLTAKGGNAGYTTNANIMLAAGIGPCSGAASVSLNLNEISTVATAFALSHFFTTTLGASSTDAFGGTAAGGGTYNAGLMMANTYTIPAVLSIPSGTALPSTATVTREAAKLNTLANIIAACVNSGGGAAGSSTACGTLFTNTTPPATSANPNPTAPTDTLQAAVQMALYPYQNVATLFNLPPATSPFVGLSTRPNDFTLGISYTATNLGLGINSAAAMGGSSNIDIDASGRIWFPSNSATAHGLADFDPTTGTFNGPYATTLTQPQYVTVDNVGNIFGTDLSAPKIAGVATSNPGGTVTLFQQGAGTTVGPIGATSNATVSNALVYAVTASNGAAALWIEQGGNQGAAISYTYPPTGVAPYNYANPNSYYEVESATNGTSSPCLFEGPYTYQGQNYGNQTQATTTGSPCVSGGVAQVDEVGNESVSVASTVNQLCSYNYAQCFAPVVPVNVPEGIAIDGDSNLWIANSGNASISTLKYSGGTHTNADYQLTSPVAYVHNTSNGGTVVKPYGIAIDNSGNVWVSNAGCVSTTGTACAPGSFVLSELIGAGAPTVTPVVAATTNANHVVRPSNVVVTHSEGANSAQSRHHLQ